MKITDVKVGEEYAYKYRNSSYSIAYKARVISIEKITEPERYSFLPPKNVTKALIETGWSELNQRYEETHWVVGRQLVMKWSEYEAAEAARQAIEEKHREVAANLRKRGLAAITELHEAGFAISVDGQPYLSRNQVEVSIDFLEDVIVKMKSE